MSPLSVVDEMDADGEYDRAEERFVNQTPLSDDHKATILAALPADEAVKKTVDQLRQLLGESGVTYSQISDASRPLLSFASLKNVRSFLLVLTEVNRDIRHAFADQNADHPGHPSMRELTTFDD